METQNVTLSIPKRILVKAKLIAVRENTSLSGLLTRTLQDIVEQDEGYERARQHHLNLLKHAPDLGTQGTIFWKREDLHER